MNLTDQIPCQFCMCYNCPRLKIPDNQRGFCRTCNHCEKKKPVVDKSNGEFCAWRRDFETNIQQY